ncbi:MAG: TIGR00266 family protein [Planctomycetes bacterium]|nr:TIGR00266 family protein [Planctomycetota bacterium]
MRYEILTKPSYSLVEVALDGGEQIVGDSGAMAWMEGDIETTTSTRGGFLAGMKRKLLSGESFFQNTFTAGGRGGRIGFAPGIPGDVLSHELEDGELFLQKGAYLASTPGIECNSKFEGLRGLFSNGLFVLRCTGTGLMFFHAYGDIQQVEVDGDYLLDNGYAVAWQPSLQWEMTRARRKIRAFLFGDQLLLRFRGRGTLWVQSRSPHTLANFAHPYRPVKRNND